MTRNKVLIITYQKDNSCIAAMTSAVEELGGEVIRFDVDRYPTDCSISSEYDGEKWTIFYHDGEQQYNLSAECVGVWYRRMFHLGDGLKDVVDKEFFAACFNESQVTIQGMLTHLEHDVNMLNTYMGVKRSSSKEEQLRVASELGMRIPRTCITNNPARASVFIASCKGGAISKMQHSFKIDSNDTEKVVFTNRVTASDIARLDDIDVCPMQFQEHIEKKVELRIIIIGDKVFAASIDTTSNKEGATDWRKVGNEMIEDWVVCAVPDVLKEQLVAFQKYYHLNYGAADVILTTEDEYVFLEVNPAGEYFWLDKMYGGEISREMAKLLLNEKKPTDHSPYKLPTKL